VEQAQEGDGMKYVNNNPFLSQVCAKLRERRPLISNNYNIRIESVNDAPFVNLWFRTRGCRHDHLGGCTMCNYDASPPVSAAEMIEFVRQGLASLDWNDRMMLLVSPSGSMFDEWEVPAQAREGIFRLVRDVRCRTFVCETRFDTLTEHLIRQYADLFDDRETCIEMGLESANPWILKYCINKSLSLDKFQLIIALLKKHRVVSVANVMLGSAFLSAHEAIQDTVQSVQWALSQGVDRCVLFPAHVKKWTLLEWLWERDLYSPPSLWALVEVLVRLGPHLVPKVTISWYKNYHRESERLDPIQSMIYLCSPTTCAECRTKVIGLLDQFRNTSDFRIIQELANFDCDCKRRWKTQLDQIESQPLKERVAQFYEIIGCGVLGLDWWEKHGDDALKIVPV
jgi:radical SAM enzyme (TIGR01210 family)